MFINFGTSKSKILFGLKNKPAVKLYKDTEKI